jgi:hypothetical protein
VLGGDEWQRLAQVLERLCIADDPRVNDLAAPPDTEARPDASLHGLNGSVHVEAVTPDPAPTAPEPTPPSPAPAAAPNLGWSAPTDDLPSGPA